MGAMRGVGVLLAVALAVAVLPGSHAAERCMGKFRSLDVYCTRLTGQACRGDALCRVSAADRECHRARLHALRAANAPSTMGG